MERPIYDTYERICGRELVNDATDLADCNDRMPTPKIDTGGKEVKLSSKFQDCVLNCTSTALMALRPIKTEILHKRYNHSLLQWCADVDDLGALRQEREKLVLEWEAQHIIDMVFDGAPKPRHTDCKVSGISHGKPQGHNKVLVFFQYHRSTDVFFKQRGSFGSKRALIHSDMGTPEHERLFKSSQNANSDLMVTIGTWTHSLQRSQLQDACCTVIIVERALNKEVEAQAMCDVHRMGQSQDFEVFRLFVVDTYMENHELHMVNKALCTTKSMAFHKMAAEQPRADPECDGMTFGSRERGTPLIGSSLHMQRA